MALKFDVDTAAQFPRDFILARWGGPDLQADGGRRAVDILYAENSRAIDQRLGPGRIAAQVGGRGFEDGERFLDGRIRREGDVYKSLRPVAAQVGDGADVAVGDSDQRAAGVANHSAAQGNVLDAAPT